MPRGGGKSNGGIIGKVNKTSFGKDKVTDKTATGNVCLQSGTRVVKQLSLLVVVAVEEIEQLVVVAVVY